MPRWAGVHDVTLSAGGAGPGSCTVPVMSDVFRLAVVGVGRMGRFHAECLADAPGLELVAVVDGRREVASEVAHIAGCRVVGSIENLTGLVDGVVVATPTPSHPEMVERALGAGLNVLCEKPISLHEGDGAALDALAAERGLVLQVGFWRRFSPPWVTARDLIREGRIGRLVLARFSQWDADPPPPGFCDPAVSGGLAVDCGVHEFDLAEWLTDDRIETVEARPLPLVDPAVGEAGDVDNLLVLLSLTSGASAIVDLSRNCRYGDDVRTEILGSDGAVFIDLLPAGRLRIADSTGVQIVESAAEPMAAGVVAQALAFARRSRGDTVAIPTGVDSDRALAVARAAQRTGA